MTGRHVSEWLPEADWWPDLEDGPQRLTEKIAAVIRSVVLSGEIQADRPVPGAFRIGRRYGVTPATARLALRLLIDEGLLRQERNVHGYQTLVN